MGPRLRIAGSPGSEPEVQPAAVAASPGVGLSVPADLAAAIESARTFRETLLRLPRVVSVRGGYKFREGRITRTPAVVVAVERKLDDLREPERVPAALPDGTPTDVTVADPVERLEAVGVAELRAGRPTLLIDQIQGDALEADALEALPVITYTPPPGGSLAPVTGPMTVTCHVSPDAGWSMLRPFLVETDREVTLGMYDFTAPHIYQAVRSLLRDSDVVWRQTLGPNESLPGVDDVDSTKADDKPEAEIIRGLLRVARDRFVSTFAHVGTGKTFASAYHIKVAVRDGSAFWLSSGNWQSSNQPAIDLLDPAADRKLIARFNREWHAVIENPELAATFELYLNHDFETAAEAPEAVLEAARAPLPDLLVSVDELLEEERAAVGLEVFPPARFNFTSQNPLTVQPILTPDNYAEVVLDLLQQRPSRRLYFQNQSLNPIKAPTAAWAELLALLASYSNDESLDVRIIFRNIGPIRAKLESLQAAGFNMDRVRVQSGCHTKGIVIDSAKVLLGSHNWTNQGVEANRDASLLIEDPEIAAYYERVFLHDWERLARAAIREEATPIPVIASEEAAAVDDVAFRRVPWSAWEEE